MNKSIKITTNEKGQAVVTSRQIAEDFGKRNSHVVDAIENKIKSLTAENSEVQIAKLFIPTTYNHNGNEYKEYLLTRDGFTFIVMGFTGAKADSWKFKYIEAFNKMEEVLKEQALNTSQLSPELQMFNQMFKAIANNELEQKRIKASIEETKEEVQAIRDVITLDSNGWRKESTNIINAIAKKLGGFGHIQPIREESYKLLNERLGVDISKRLLNKRKNMALEGVSKSKIDKVNKLDVIAEDKKLIDGYVNIVRQFAIKYGIA